MYAAHLGCACGVHELVRAETCKVCACCEMPGALYGFLSVSANVPTFGRELEVNMGRQQVFETRVGIYCALSLAHAICTVVLLCTRSPVDPELLPPLIICTCAQR